MEITKYLDDILALADKVSKKDNNDGYKKLVNAIKVYYIGVNTAFIVDRVLKKVDFSNEKITDNERKHIENIGWVLGEEWRSDVYMGALKANMILDTWMILKSHESDFSIASEKQDAFSGLVESLHNNAIATKDFTIDLEAFGGKGIEIKSGDTVDFVTPEDLLRLIEWVLE